MAKPKPRLRTLKDIVRAAQSEGLQLAISAKATIFHVTLKRRGFIRASVSECSLTEALDGAYQQMTSQRLRKTRRKP